MKASLKKMLFGLAWMVGIHFVAVRSNQPVAIVAASAVVGYLPVGLIVWWIAASDKFAKMRDSVKKPWPAIILSVVLAVYWLYSHKWAGDEINDIFAVDPRFFPVTTTVLAWLLTPFGVIGSKGILPTVVSFLCAALVAVLSWTLIAVLFVRGATFMERLKGGLVLCVAIAFSASYGSSVIYLMQAYRPVVKRFAIWADFNSRHLCSGLWSKDVESVLFLDGDKVLAHYRNGPFEFQVEQCEFYIPQMRDK